MRLIRKKIRKDYISQSIYLIFPQVLSFLIKSWKRWLKRCLGIRKSHNDIYQKYLRTLNSQPPVPDLSRISVFQRYRWYCSRSSSFPAFRFPPVHVIQGTGYTSCVHGIRTAFAPRFPWIIAILYSPLKCRYHVFSDRYFLTISKWMNFFYIQVNFWNDKFWFNYPQQLQAHKPRLPFPEFKSWMKLGLFVCRPGT